jgi:phospholipase C
MPSDKLSEDPPANITLGMDWVVNVVDSIMNSQYWNSTAIILTWDDYGGFYDHVPPPELRSTPPNSYDGFSISYLLVIEL